MTGSKPEHAAALLEPMIGQVIDGMDVVDKIRLEPVSAYQVHQHLPVKPILITKATVEK